MNIPLVYLEPGDKILFIMFGIIFPCYACCVFKYKSYRKEKRFFESFWNPTIFTEHHTDKIYKIIDIHDYPNVHEGKMVVIEVDEECAVVGESFWTYCNTVHNVKSGYIIYPHVFNGTIVCVTHAQKPHIEDVYYEIREKNS